MPEEKEALNAKIVTWARAAGLVIAALSAGYGGTAIRGEPGAETAYKALAKAFNELQLEFAKQQSYQQGFLEALKARLQAKTQPPAQQPPTPVQKCETKPQELPRPAVSRAQPAPEERPVRPTADSPPAPSLQELLPPTLKQLKRE